MNNDPQSSPRWVHALLHSLWPVALLLGCHLWLGLSAAHRKTLTFDEGLHLAAGESYWVANDYRLNAESGNWPQRWAAVPVWLEGNRFPPADDSAWINGMRYDFSNEFLYASGNDADSLIFQGRVMIGLLSAALGAVVYFWSRQLFGVIGGLISLSLYAFSPTMLGNGWLVTSDLAGALFFTAASWSLWTFLQRVSPFTVAISSFTLAGLVLSKFSGVLIVPMGLLLLGVRLCNSKPLVVALGGRYAIRGRLKQLAVLAGAMLLQLLVVDLLIWASYGFRYATLNPSARQEVPFTTAWEYFADHLGMVRPVVEFIGERHWLPEPFLYGFSYTLSTTEARRAFLNGEFGTHGWLGFFPYCLAVKTRLEVFVILLLGAAGAWFWRGTSGRDGRLSSTNPGSGHLYSLTPLWVLLAVYWMFSLTSHLNIGQRHLLPTYPPMFILAGAAACWFRAWPKSLANQPRETGRKAVDVAPSSPSFSHQVLWGARVLLAGSLVLAMLEGLWMWPDYLAYFNVLAGGPAQGYKHLVDSSLDWGQDLKELKRWLDAHPDDTHDPRRVYLSYFGEASSTYYGIDAIRLPGFIDVPAPGVPKPLAGGAYCISATMLEGVYFKFPGKWNARYEDLYQQLSKAVLAYRQAGGNADAIQQITSSIGAPSMDQVCQLYEQLQMARLCAFLRQREPDDNVGHSILIYRLSDAEIQKALEGAPVELLPDCEPEAKASLPIRTMN
ncbi:MAG TPA: hypothetical protein VMJ32_03800 [Pirellulales bacterium]|nr:hypothetical protein [Pirellulales bacterium]